VSGRRLRATRAEPSEVERDDLPQEQD
jgi:hypothetical protein